MLLRKSWAGGYLGGGEWRLGEGDGEAQALQAMDQPRAGALAVELVEVFRPQFAVLLAPEEQVVGDLQEAADHGDGGPSLPAPCRDAVIELCWPFGISV